MLTLLGTRRLPQRWQPADAAPLLPPRYRPLAPSAVHAVSRSGLVQNMMETSAHLDVQGAGYSSAHAREVVFHPLSELAQLRNSKAPLNGHGHSKAPWDVHFARPARRSVRLAARRSPTPIQWFRPRAPSRPLRSVSVLDRGLSDAPGTSSCGSRARPCSRAWSPTTASRRAPSSFAWRCHSRSLSIRQLVTQSLRSAAKRLTSAEQKSRAALHQCSREASHGARLALVRLLLHLLGRHGGLGMEKHKNPRVD